LVSRALDTINQEPFLFAISQENIKYLICSFGAVNIYNPLEESIMSQEIRTFIEEVTDWLLLGLVSNEEAEKIIQSKIRLERRINQ